MAKKKVIIPKKFSAPEPELELNPVEIQINRLDDAAAAITDALIAQKLNGYSSELYEQTIVILAALDK